MRLRMAGAVWYKNESFGALPAGPEANARPEENDAFEN